MLSTVAALAVLLHFLQIAPALLCTFNQLPPSAMIKVPAYHNKSSPYFKHVIGDCMKMCYEYEPCVYVISFKSGLCSASPSEGETMRADATHDFDGNHGVVYRLDRNATATVCPKLEEWLEQTKTAN